MESGVIDTVLLSLRLVAALGSRLMAGLFFAFSISVMGGLARIQPAEGIAAMQSINRAIPIGHTRQGIRTTLPTFFRSWMKW